MMTKQNACLRLLLSFLLSFMLLGCGAFSETPRQMQYYTLSYDPPAPAVETTESVVLAVERFTAQPPYQSNRIVYADSIFRRSTYIYHQWQTNPADMVTPLIVRDFRKSNLFKSVLYPPTDQLRPTHRLKGVIEAFYEDDIQNNWKAVLSITITLLENADELIERDILLQKTYHSSAPLSQNNPLGLADAMSRAMSGVSLEIRTDIQRALRY